MEDKRSASEPGGAEDSLRPRRPGGERKQEGETDQRPDPANAIPTHRMPSPPIGAQQPPERKEEDRASGMMDDPVGTG